MALQESGTPMKMRGLGDVDDITLASQVGYSSLAKPCCWSHDRDAEGRVGRVMVRVLFVAEA